MRAVCPGCGQTIDTESNEEGNTVWTYHDKVPGLRALCPASKQTVAVKVHVTFDDSEHMAGEYLWALPTERAHHFKIDNIPFFADDIALGDVVRVSMAIPAEACVHGPKCSLCAAREVVAVSDPTGHSTGRLYFKQPIPVDQRQATGERIRNLGVKTEWGNAQLLAVDFPPGVKVADVLDTLPPNLEAECDLLDA